MTPAIVRTVLELRTAIGTWRKRADSVGLVPTMGALHEGHLALVRASQAQCRRTVVSIFVNPTQFGPNSDFARYPRDLAGDVAKLATVGADLVFAPDVGDMYPPGFATTVTVARISEGLCGPHRPGHFAGVATIVTKLLLQTMPDAAYFGEKDYQQVMVVRRMVLDLSIPVEIVAIPTVRADDGVALSSRNVYLTPEERRAAVRLNRALALARSLVEEGVASPAALERSVRDYISQEPLAGIDLVAIRDADTLEDPGDAFPDRILVLLFVRFGKARLLDHTVIERRTAES